MIPYCIDCGRYFRDGEILFHPPIYLFAPPIQQFICQKCSKRKTMPNIKITAEVDGKIVPLNTISTESFEAIKALEKPKEIPVARIGNYSGQSGDRRLFLKITNSIKRCIVKDNVIVIAIDPRNGHVTNSWAADNKNLKTLDGKMYTNVKPL